MRYTGILVGSFNGFHDVVMDRSCIERDNRESALEDAKLMLKLCVNCDPKSDANSWIADVEVTE